MSDILYYQNKKSMGVVNFFNAEILITGGHGGLVTYDGNGGVLEKRGAPVDRVFLLTNDGRFLADAVLDIDYGCLNFRTGKLKGSVKIIESETQDTRVRYNFMANRAKNSIEIIGGIQRLDIPRYTVLVSGNVAPSIMEARTDDKSGTDSRLPYVAYHNQVVVNKQILKWFDIPNAKVLGAASAWDKPNPDPKVVHDRNAYPNNGVPFETQQHLGFTRIFLKI